MMANYLSGKCPICGEEDCQGQDSEVLEIIQRMGKTLIGTCGDCYYWIGPDDILEYLGPIMEPESRKLCNSTCTNDLISIWNPCRDDGCIRFKEKL